MSVIVRRMRPSRWVVSTAAMMSLLAANAAAQEKQENAASDSSPVYEAQSAQTVSFDIPAQPLAQALTAFGRQSGVQVAFDPAATAGKTSVAVSARACAVPDAVRTATAPALACVR